MRSTAIDRRRFALALGALGGSALTALAGRPVCAAGTGPLYLGARNDAVLGHRVTGFGPDGAVRFDLPLPARGHGFAVDAARGVAVAFARRPERWARVVDLRRGALRGAFVSPDDRHFYGHGAFSADGRLLYAAENDFAARRGVIGVYDAADGYRRIGELPSHGIGPHQIALMPDGETLAVANGGIATRPDMPRLKLNVPTMRPSLALVNRRDGRLARRVGLPAALHRLGIRHLSVDRAARPGRIALGMQYEGPAGDRVPLVGIAEPEGSLRLFEGPAAPLRAMRHYCGSIEFDRSGRLIAASSPRGGVVTIWAADDGRHLRTLALRDGCGLAPAAAGGFIASDGTGRLSAIAAEGRALSHLDDWEAADTAWDNHLAATRQQPPEMP